jgi:hypothetical protein
MIHNIANAVGRRPVGVAVNTAQVTRILQASTCTVERDVARVVRQPLPRRDPIMTKAVMKVVAATTRRSTKAIWTTTKDLALQVFAREGNGLEDDGHAFRIKRRYLRLTDRSHYLIFLVHSHSQLLMLFDYVIME